jgi:dual specificity phosphatase 3
VSTLPELRVANAQFVTPRLLVGGDLDTRDLRLATQQLDELVACGLTHIVDVRIEWSDQEWVANARPALRYLHVGLDDMGQRVPGWWFDEAVGAVLESLEESKSVVLVHCHMGINRGPSLAYAVLLAQGVDPVDALEAIRSVRPIAYMSYAEDALRWHLDRTRAGRRTRLETAHRVARWRRDNDLDVAEVIRLKREEGY